MHDNALFPLISSVIWDFVRRDTPLAFTASDCRYGAIVVASAPNYQLVKWDTGRFNLTIFHGLHVSVKLLDVWMQIIEGLVNSYA